MPQNSGGVCESCFCFAMRLVWVGIITQNHRIYINAVVRGVSRYLHRKGLATKNGSFCQWLNKFHEKASETYKLSTDEIPTDAGWGKFWYYVRMVLFHGSTVEVRAPRLLTPNRALNLGSGFYTTLFRLWA